MKYFANRNSRVTPTANGNWGKKITQCIALKVHVGDNAQTLPY